MRRGLYPAANAAPAAVLACLSSSPHTSNPPPEVRRLDALQQLAVGAAPDAHRAIRPCRGQQRAAAAAKLQAGAGAGAAGQHCDGGDGAARRLDAPQQARACGQAGRQTRSRGAATDQQQRWTLCTSLAFQLLRCVERQARLQDAGAPLPTPTHRCCRPSCEGRCRTGCPRRRPPPAASRRAAPTPLSRCPARRVAGGRPSAAGGPKHASKCVPAAGPELQRSLAGGGKQRFP